MHKGFLSPLSLSTSTFRSFYFLKHFYIAAGISVQVPGPNSTDLLPDDTEEGTGETFWPRPLPVPYSWIRNFLSLI